MSGTREIKTERLIGVIGAYDYDPSNDTIEVGMSIEKASWGKGYAGEVLTEILRYLSEEENIGTVTAWCEEENIGSEKAMLKAGMEKTGMERSRCIFRYVKGERKDG